MLQPFYFIIKYCNNALLDKVKQKMIIKTKIIEINEDKSEETKQTQVINESPSQLSFSFQNDILDIEKFRDSYFSL